MKVADLLEKLDISFDVLCLIGNQMGVEIKNDEQRLIPFEMKRLERFTSRNDFSEAVVGLVNYYNLNIKDTFSDGKDHYFIGTVKWFSDPERLKDYGFANIDRVGDVYFQRKDVYSTNSDFLKPGSDVIIRIPNGNLSIEQRKKASRINFWADEENISFLAYLKIQNQIPLGNKRILDVILKEKLVSLTLQQKKLLNTFLDNIPSEIFDPNQLAFFKDLYKFCDKEFVDSILFNKLNKHQKFEVWLRDSDLIAFDDVFELLKVRISSKEEIIDSLTKSSVGQRITLFETVLSELQDGSGSIEEFMNLFRNALKYEVCLSYELLSDELVFKIWRTKAHKIPITVVKRDLAKILPYDNLRIPEAFLEESKEDQQQIFQFTLEQFSSEQNLRALSPISDFLTLFRRANDLDLNLSTNTLDPLISHSLWRQKLVKKASVSEIYKDYLKIFNSLLDSIDVNISEVIKHEYPEDLQRLDQDEISNLLAVHFYDLENLSQKDYHFFKILIKLDLSSNQKEKLISLVKSKTDGYVSLRLFVDNHVDTIDYDDAVLYTALLNNEDQKLFFKKCLALVEQGKAKWSISDFKRIVSIDYELYAQSKSISIGDFKLDFSLAMILHIVDQIANGEKVNQQSILGIVANVIKDPKELIEITGFFDECHNRQSIRQINNSDPAEYELTHYKDSNPRFATYCEGRKAMINKETPAICDRSGEEFYWCENAKCYHIARKPHVSSEWENYSLADVLRILNIEFSDIQYEQLIGTINKANRFFEHLTCRTCENILHPSGKDNYGFYRVSNFCCNNVDCSEDKNKNIYLSHCANGSCLDIVDSRDTVRCKTDGREDKCGWYVCNNCHSCCTTKNINSRAFILKKMGQEYNCHIEGHLDRQKLCCNKCGTEMNETGSNYDEVLNWFLVHKDSHPNIGKSGENKYHKKWFIWQKGNLSHEEYRASIINLRGSGFNIPDFEDEYRSSYLIAEPRDTSGINTKFKCPECKNELIIREGTLPVDQYFAIKKYHFVKT